MNLVLAHLAFCLAAHRRLIKGMHYLSIGSRAECENNESAQAKFVYLDLQISMLKKFHLVGLSH